MDQVCSNCRYYQPFFQKGNHENFHPAGSGKCWYGILNGRKRVPVRKKDGSPACEGFSEVEPDTRKRLSFTISSYDDSITGSCTLLLKDE